MVSPSLAIDGPPQNVRSYSLERSSSQNREHASTNEYSRILKPSLCLENGGSGEVGLTQYASSYPYRSDQWHIHWVGPTILLTGLVLGTGCAVAHHFFYLTYDGTEASEWSQQKVHFAGQAFARITSLLLTASAAAAYRQWVWSLLKRRALPISSIDTLFVLDSSVLELILGWRTWLIATTTMLFACMLWSLQVASIITPGAMSTKTHQWIRSANVSAQQARICQFGFTSTGSGNIGDSSQMGCYEYYNEGFDRINTGLTRTISGTAYSGEIPVFDSPCNSENCTLEFDYVAPTLRCASMDNPSNLTEEFPNNPYLTDNLTEAYDPFLTFAGTSTGNPEYGDALEFNMTVLTGIEPITYESYTCNIWNTSMLYTFTFQQGKSTTISPAREPTLLNLVLYELSTGTSVLTWFSQVVNLLDGTVSGEKDTTGVIYDVSGISNTGVTVNANISYVRDTSLRRYIYTGADRLAAGYDPSAPGNIGTGLEELTRNISVAISLIMDFPLPVVANTTTETLVFAYHKPTLLAPYEAVVFVTLILAVSGAVMIIRNGYVTDFRFSTALRTTRNHALDSLTEGTELGAAPLPKRIADLKLQFGLVTADDDGLSRALQTSFGHEGSVDLLERNAKSVQ